MKKRYKELLKKAAAISVTASLLLLGACGTDITEVLQTSTQPEETTEAVTAAPVYYSEAPQSVEKHETVFVKIDNAGKVLNTIVSDRLHTDRGQVAVADMSDLTNIVNVKSDILPVYGENGKLTWHMDTQDLYYRGESTKELPISIELKYFLDGKEVTPEEIAGKSGEVTVEATMQNKLSKTVEIGGEQVKVYNPMIVAGVAIFPSTNFENVYTQSGKLISDGSKEIAILLAAPGIDESLELSQLGIEGIEELEFSNTISVSATATDFTMGNMFFAALPLSSITTEIELSSTFGELQDSLGKIKELESAMTELDAKELLNTFFSSSDKIDEVIGIAENAVSLYNSNKVLLETLPKYMTDENIEILSKLLSDMDSTEVQEFVELMSNPVFTKFLNIVPDLAADITDALPIIEEFAADMEKPEMQEAIDNLPQTLEQLKSLQGAIEDNAELLDSLSQLLSGDNLEKIDTILGTVADEDLESKLKEYGVLADDIDVLISRFNAMLEFSKEYTIYSAAEQGATSNVMFIYQTPGISQT